MRYEVIVNGVSYLVEVKALEQQESKPGFIPLASSAPSTPPRLRLLHYRQSLSLKEGQILSKVRCPERSFLWR